MPKTRLSGNKGLPARWRYYHGAYIYRVPPGLEAKWEGKTQFRLGTTLPEAFRAFAERINRPSDVGNTGQLFDRYAKEVLPAKAPKTQYDHLNHLRRLRAVFGMMPLTDIQPHHVYRYVDLRGARVSAHREIEVLSHAFTKAVEWGLINRHPFKGQVRLKGEAPRTRYIEDWEVEECLALEPMRKRGGVRVIQAYIRLKLLTGMARGDLLRLEPARHFKDDGIHVQRHKTAKTTGQRTIYEWTPERRAAVDDAKAARPVDISPFLFCNALGKCYIDEARGTASGFNSMWQNFMGRLLAETKVVERFTEHDLRAKCASDAASLETARKLLAHVDSRMTARVYRRKPERV
jgi:integrase